MVSRCDNRGSDVLMCVSVLRDKSVFIYLIKVEGKQDIVKEKEREREETERKGRERNTMTQRER